MKMDNTTIELTEAEMERAMEGKPVHLPFEYPEGSGKWKVVFVSLEMTREKTYEEKKTALLKHLESQGVWHPNGEVSIRDIPTDLVSICGAVNDEGLISILILPSGKRHIKLTNEGRRLLKWRRVRYQIEDGR